MHLENDGGSYPGPASDPQLNLPVARPLIGRISDKLLGVSWVFFYAVLLWIFRTMKSLETKSTVAADQSAVSSSR
jgi:hypothetical protein